MKIYSRSPSEFLAKVETEFTTQPEFCLGHFFPCFLQHNTMLLLHSRLQLVSSNSVSLAKMDWSTEQQPFYQGSPSRWLWESENQSTIFPRESFESGPSLTQPLPTDRQRKSGLEPVSHMLVLMQAQEQAP